MFSKGFMNHTWTRILVCLLLFALLIPAVGEEPMPTATPIAVEDSEIAPDESDAISSEDADPVQEEGAQLNTQPVLMVTDYAIVEGDTAPGSSFVLEMNIANLSERKSAYNVMATLTIENVSVSLKMGVTNQIYYHEIPPMQSVTARFPMEVYSYCTDENMILTMTMTCRDDAVVDYDFQTMMTPTVDVLRTLQVSSLTVPQFVHRNSSMIISATLTNVEPVTLNNVKMHVVTQYGEEITEVGQLLKEESKNVNCIYRFPEQKTEEVKVYFTYESLYGQAYTTDLETFEVIVYDPAVQDDFASSGKAGIRAILNRLTENTVIPVLDAEIPIPVFAWIAAGVLGYVIVLICVLKRKGR